MNDETIETTQQEHKASNGILTDISRGLALFLGTFSLLNILGELRYPGFDTNHWWIDLSFVSGWIKTVILYVVSVSLLWYGFKPVLSRFRRILTALLVGALAGICIGHAATFYWLVRKGTLESGFLLAFSVMVFVALTIVLLAIVFGSSVVFGVLVGSFFGLSPPDDSLLGRLHVLDINNYNSMITLSVVRILISG